MAKDDKKSVKKTEKTKKTEPAKTKVVEKKIEKNMPAKKEEVKKVSVPKEAAKKEDAPKVEVKKDEVKQPIPKKQEIRISTDKKADSNQLVMPRKSSAVVYILLVFAIILSVTVAQIFTTKKVDDIVLSQLNYHEQGAVNYKVYYNKNEWYDKEADLSQPIMASYVDKITANYNYYHLYSDKLNGKYEYVVTATLKVYDPTDESNVYWAPSYKLVDAQVVNFEGKKDYRILKDVSIDYEKYRNQYLDYKSKSSLATKAKLVVEFKVINNGEYKGLDSIRHESNILLDIPVSEAAFKIATTTSIKPEEQSIKNVEDNEAERVYCMIIAGLCWVLAIFFAGVLLIVYRVNAAKESIYSRKLRKILNTYDSIIVNVEKLPKLSDLSVVNVTTFEELVDAQMEVRLPINFYEDEKNHVSKFVLVRNNLAWVYTLEEVNSREK